MDKPLTTLVGFAEALMNAVCSNRNCRTNNTAMLAALNAKEMPQFLNQSAMHMGVIAYKSVLAVIIRAQLTVPSLDEGMEPLILTYDRFNRTLTETRRHLLTVNS